MSGGIREIDIIGYDSGWGCRDYGCQDGPEFVDRLAISTAMQSKGYHVNWLPSLGIKSLGDRAAFSTKDQTLSLTLSALEKLYEQVLKTVTAGRFPVVIGGDHASGIATWSAIAAAKNIASNMGLIWVDAHLDSHTYETSFQGKYGGWWHGQPVAALLGYGLPEFTSMGGATAKISPQHLCFIGAHSYEPLEKELLDRLQVRVLSLNETENSGFHNVFAQSVAGMRAAKGFGVSIDLDVFHPDDAPGVGAPEETGLRAKYVLPGLKNLARDKNLLGIEIVEYNPHRDIDRKTQKLITQILTHIFLTAVDEPVLDECGALRHNLLG